MEANAQLLAWHGWAFDRTCWDPWHNVLPDRLTFQAYDRGYWGDPRPIEMDETIDSQIFFTHSFGLHLCPADQLTSADMLVIFGGFREFHPAATQFKRRSKLVLNQMIESMQKEPVPVLNEFMKNTYKPHLPPEFSENGFNGEKLLHDLHSLNQSTLDIEPLRQIPKVCILHGSADSIVPKTKGRELYNILEEQASYFEVRDAGHALPFTHTEQCWAFIQPELKEIL